MRLLPLLLMTCSAFVSAASSAPPELIVEESKVPPHDLPDVLRAPSGQLISSAAEWEQMARPALLATFASHVYGETPPADSVRVTTEDATAHPILGGRAVLRQVRLRLHRGERSAAFDLLIALPAGATPAEPAPALVGLNFWGNHTIDAEPSIRPPHPGPGLETKERGSYARRWNLATLIERGYAVATASRGEIAPDSPAHFATGILSLFPDHAGDHRMGAIGAWAFALSRIADHLASIPEIDSARLTVVGHSRLGKAALWAAAQDTRFSRVFANNSGCMGAALSRREFGETVAIITRNFPYWFSPRLATYADRVDELPVDQHQLLALIAPRPLHLGSAQEDLWADPRGELLALRAAAPAYALYGITSELPDQLPPPDALPVGTVLRFHRREGKHDLLPADWNAYLAGLSPHPAPGPDVGSSTGASPEPCSSMAGPSSPRQAPPPSPALAAPGPVNRPPPS